MKILNKSAVFICFMHYNILVTPSSQQFLINSFSPEIPVIHFCQNHRQRWYWKWTNSCSPFSALFFPLPAYKQKTTFPISESVEKTKSPIISKGVDALSYERQNGYRWVKGCCLSYFQIIVTGHPYTEKVTNQTNGHDGDDCCCIHCFAFLNL